MKNDKLYNINTISLSIAKYDEILIAFSNMFYKEFITQFENNTNTTHDGNLEIFKENFDILNTELLKNNIIGKLHNHSGYTFNSRINSSRYEIMSQQRLFYESVKLFSLNISSTASVQKKFIIIFNNKTSFVHFNNKYFNDQIIITRHFLRVIYYFII